MVTFHSPNPRTKNADSPAKIQWHLIWYVHLQQVVEDTSSESSCILATQMFLMPSLIVMSIGATRMYRSLVEGFYNDKYGTLQFQ